MKLHHFFQGQSSNRANFDITCTVHELNNVPYLGGFFYFKWKFPFSITSRGASARLPVENHTIQWNHVFHAAAVLRIDKNGALKPLHLSLQFHHFDSEKNKSNLIGSLLVNIADFVEKAVITKRFLVKDSRMNSTVKLTIELQQTGGIPMIKISPPKGDPSTGQLPQPTNYAASLDSEHLPIDDASSIISQNPPFLIADYSGGVLFPHKMIYSAEDTDKLIEQLFEEAAKIAKQSDTKKVNADQFPLVYREQEEVYSGFH